jgi:hypothetical protein
MSTNNLEVEQQLDWTEALLILQNADRRIPRAGDDPNAQTWNFINVISVFYIETAPRCVEKMDKPTQNDHLLRPFRSPQETVLEEWQDSLCIFLK